jgi:hypothetical protein
MSDFPPPPPPSPHQPQPVAQRAPRNGLAVAALILGVVGVLSVFFPFGLWVAGILGTVGLILGLIGYGRFQRSEATNGTMALWGIIIGAVALVVSIVGAVILVGTNVAEELAAKDAAERTVSPSTETSAPAQPEETAPTGTEVVDVFDLEVGDCFAEIEDTEEMLSTIETVPCSLPHSEEVFAAETLPDEDFPGEDAVNAQADELCFTGFEEFVGLPFEESVLSLAIFVPSEESWRMGDRLVLCTIYDPRGDVSGSLRGVER